MKDITITGGDVTKRLSDRQMVYNYLCEKGKISVLEAERFGCHRLSARIGELRHKYGVRIRTERMPVKSGDPVAVYHLEKDGVKC